MTIVFDLDGTLIDSIGDITAAVNTLRSARKQPLLSETACAEFVGWGAKYLLQHTIDFDPEHGKEVYREFISAYSDVIGQFAHPYQGIPELLSALHTDGHTLAVLSNKPHELTVRCVQEALPNVFTSVLGKRDGIPAKPDPYGLSESVALFGNQQSVFVGDSEVDVQTARHAGVDCIAVSWGLRSKAQLEEAKAAVIVDSVAQLQSALNKGN